MIYSTHLFRHVRFTIGQTIQRHRVAQKMTLTKLSRLTGISENKLDQYELGKNEISLQELLKVTCVLKIETSKIYASSV